MYTYLFRFDSIGSTKRSSWTSSTGGQGDVSHSIFSLFNVKPMGVTWKESTLGLHPPQKAFVTLNIRRVVEGLDLEVIFRLMILISKVFKLRSIFSRRDVELPVLQHSGLGLFKFWKLGKIYKISKNISLKNTTISDETMNCEQ